MRTTMISPLPLTSLSLVARFILNPDTRISSADHFTITVACSENPRPITVLLPARLELKVSQLHRLRLGGSSLGKSLHYAVAHRSSIPQYITRR